jgi:uncharacterized protein
MLFNVSALLREPVGSTRRYRLEPEEPVHRGQVELTRIPGGVLVRCHAGVVIEAACSRCLADFGYPVEVAFEEVFVQQVDEHTGARLPAPDDPDAFRIGIDHSIDISEAVRQYSETAAALQPLCRSECPGLCPECGQDLNAGECGCRRVHTDPRWEALAALKLTANG